jgi:hypothetical protein
VAIRFGKIIKPMRPTYQSHIENNNKMVGSMWAPYVGPTHPHLFFLLSPHLHRGERRKKRRGEDDMRGPHGSHHFLLICV